MSLITELHKNGLLQIYKNAEAVASSPTPDVLSCSELRRYWLSWWDGTIRLHRYDSQGQQLVTWSEENFMAIGAVQLLSGPGGDGEWIVDREACKYGERKIL